MKSLLLSGVLAGGLALGLSASANPYDPEQRALGGAATGATSGAAIGAAAAGGGGGGDRRAGRRRRRGGRRGGDNPAPAGRWLSVTPLRRSVRLRPRPALGPQPPR